MPARIPPTGDTDANGDLADSLALLIRSLPSQPCHHVRQARKLLSRLAATLVEPEAAATALADQRFSDPAWHSNPLLMRVMAVWATCNHQGREWLQGLQLPLADQARLALLGRQLAAASAPSNSPLNPRFLARLRETRGRSLCRGLQHLAADLALDRPTPPLHPDDSHLVGRELASTAGEVVLRQPLFEMIQYQPLQAKVHSHPLLIIPPPLNRFYLLDLSPHNSLVQHALEQGLQVFLISWRNPDHSHRDWGFNQYVAACDSALQHIEQISNSTQTSLLGVCAGGLLGLMLQGVLQARGEAHRLCAASYLVTPLNAHMDTDLLRLMGSSSRQRLRTRVWQQGYLSGPQLARSFAWLRPDHFVWPQAVERYAMDQAPAQRDLLFWSQDATRLPARLVDDLLDLFERDPLAEPGHLCVLGQRLDLASIETPSWHMGAEGDHIVPWRNCFPGSRLGGNKVFVQSHGGHIQSMVNPGDRPGSRFRSSAVASVSAEQWLDDSELHDGSWWPHWSHWLKQHSGPLQQAPAHLGSDQLPPLAAAPGSYVHQS